MDSSSSPDSLPQAGAFQPPNGAAGSGPAVVPNAGDSRGFAPNDGGGRAAAPNGGGRMGGPDGGRGGFGGGPGGGGAFGTGQPGLLRLFTGSLSNEISWLLPFGLFAGLLLAFRSHLRWPLSPVHQAAVLWGGWLLTATVFFSVAGFFHPYYLVMLAPPLAALVGLGVAELWQIRRERWWLALALAAVAVGGTTVLQLKTATSFTSAIWWLPLVAVVFGAGVVLSLVARGRWPRAARAGFACLAGAMLITPGIWSGLTTLYARGIRCRRPTAGSPQGSRALASAAVAPGYR